MNKENWDQKKSVINSTENANKKRENTTSEGSVVYYSDLDGDYHIEQDDETEQMDIRN